MIEFEISFLITLGMGYIAYNLYLEQMRIYKNKF